MQNNTAIGLIFLFVALLILMVHLSGNTLEYNRSNAGWNGTSEFFNLPDRHTTTAILSLSELAGRDNTTLLLIAPKEKFTADNCSYYRDFITEGNTLFLVDDFGTGSSLLRGIGSSMTIRRGTLASVDRAYNDSYSVVTYPTEIHPLTENVTSLVLDQASTVEGGMPLIRSSMMSWIDTDGDRRLTTEEMGKYAVLAHESFGAGEIYVLTDPSIFINSMVHIDEKWSNKIFISNLIRISSPLLIDQTNSLTHHNEGVSGGMQTMKNDRNVRIIGIAIILILLVVFTQKWKRE